MRYSRILTALALLISLSLLLSTFSVQAGSGGGSFQDKNPPDEPSDDYSGGSAAVTDASPVDEMPAGDPAPDDSFAPSSKSDVTLVLGDWRNLRPTESYLRGISMLPEAEADGVDCESPDQKSKGWIVGDSGVILGYCNGVWDHAIVVESIPTNLWGVDTISNTLAVAVGAQGAVLLYLYDPVAGDWVWTKSPIPVGNQTLYDVDMVPNGADVYTGWAVGSQDANGFGTLVKGTVTKRPGSSPVTYDYQWNNLTSNYPALPQVDYLVDVLMLSPTNGWAVGGKDGVRGVILHWNGSSWSLFQEIGTQVINKIYMKSANDGWAVGRGGTIYHFNGSAWSPFESPTTAQLNDVAFDSAGQGWIVGKGGVILNRTGNTWTTFTDLRTDAFDYRSLDFTGGQGWLIGFHESKGIGGQILEYQDGLWLAVTPPTDNRLNDVAVVDDNDAWAVGMADGLGGTIIHWDGEHWRRWFQSDLPIPAVNLHAIDMTSPTDGWVAGDPPSAGLPAIFLHWDGHRWTRPRFDAPLNVRVNALAMLDKDFGWAVADAGNAEAKYDGTTGYWSANHTDQGIYYQLRDVSIVTATLETSPFEWDAWALGTSLNPATGEYFLRYREPILGSGFAWDDYAQPAGCDGSGDGPSQTRLFGIAFHPDQWGLAAGKYTDRASIYGLNGGVWTTDWCEPSNSPYRPSQLYTTDIVEESDVGWYGGYFTSQKYGRKWAYILVNDALGLRPMWDIFPVNGKNIYHRPILDLEMATDTMGWAVGDGEDPANRSVIYQYPHPNFTLEVDPQARAVQPGGAASYALSVNSPDGFGGTVDVGVFANIPGGQATLSSGTLTADAPGTITVETGALTPEDVYEMQVVGQATIRSGDNDVPVVRYATFRLTVTDNPVYSVTPGHGPASTEVTISGANFGSDPGAGNRSTPSNHVILADEQMPDSAIASWSNNEIKVVVPDDVALFPHGPQLGEVSVTAGASQSNTDLTFQLENFLDSITSQNTGAEYQVTVTGTSLGSDPGGLFRSTSLEHISLGGAWIANADVISWSNNTIAFKVPLGTGSGSVTVTSNGYESNALAFIPGTGPGGGEKVYLPLVIK